MMSFRRATLHAAALVAAGTIMSASDAPGSLRFDSFFAKAEARVGRPMTPMSYAGVARRTTRRTVAVTAGAAAAYGATAGSCQQVVDVYGRVVTQCY
jgi:hypothetical protein